MIKKDKKQTTHTSICCIDTSVERNTTHVQCCQIHKHMTLKSRFCSESVKFSQITTFFRHIWLTDQMFIWQCS